MALFGNQDESIGIAIQTTSDDKGIKETNKGLDSVTDKTKDVEDKSASLASGWKDNMNKVAVATGVVAAGLTAYSKSATNYAVNYVKETKNIARITGETVEDTSKLVAAGKKLGLTSDQLSVTFGVLSKKIVETTNSAKPQETALGQLNVAVKNADGSSKKFNDVLFQIADKFKTLPDGPKKTALAMDIFGRSGKDMIKILNLGSDGIQDLENKAEKMGLTLSSKNVAQIDAYVKSQKALKDQTDQLKLSVGLATTPVLTDFNLKLNEITQSLIGTDGPIRTLTVDVLAFGGPVLGATAAVIGFAANLGTVITTAAELGVTLHGLQAFLLASTGWAVFAASAVAAFVIIRNSANDTMKVLDDVNASIDRATATTDAALKRANEQYKSGKISKERFQQILIGSQARAGGGPVSPGQVYRVNERGQEYFQPQVAGRIIPAGQVSNNSNTTIGTVNLNTTPAVDRFFEKMGRNQFNASRGLTPVSGG